MLKNISTGKAFVRTKDGLVGLAPGEIISKARVLDLERIMATGFFTATNEKIEDDLIKLRGELFDLTGRNVTSEHTREQLLAEISEAKASREAKSNGEKDETSEEAKSDDEKDETKTEAKVTKKPKAPECVKKQKKLD